MKRYFLIPISVPVSPPLFSSRRTLYSHHFLGCHQRFITLNILRYTSSLRCSRLSPTSANILRYTSSLRCSRLSPTSAYSLQLSPTSVCSLQLPLTSAYSIPLPIPIVRAFCANSRSNYQFNFDHNIPVLELEQMIINQKVDYDYPIYWSNSLKLMDEMQNFRDFEGTLPLSRTNRKSQHLLHIIDRYSKVFSSIVQKQKDYELRVTFCKLRAELDSLIYTKMIYNYVKRFNSFLRIFFKNLCFGSAFISCFS